LVWRRVRIGYRNLSVALLLGCGVACCQTAADPRLHDLLSIASAGEIQGASPKYVGPGSCAASACHGAIQPLHITKVRQNEYSTWVTQDKHAHAYKALQEEWGKRIGVILNLPEPSAKSPRCLVCHALNVPSAEHARELDLAEGVSCESCHGPASKWLGPHIVALEPGVDAKTKHAEMVKLGLFDNKDLAQRTEKCLTCHLGSDKPNMSVDHALIAAGHPDLIFELDSYTAVEPPHWDEKGRDAVGPADPLFGVRAWAVGQAVQLQQSMLRVSRHAKQGPWPEFSEMDCMTCHHPLTGQGSWRQVEASRDHRAAGDPPYGDPPYNLSRYVLFRHFAAEIEPKVNDDLGKESRRVAELVTRMSPDRGAVEVAANRAAELAGRMVAGMRDATYDSARTESLLRSITADDAIAYDGERTAEQATMTIDSLYIAVAKAGMPSPATRQAIDGLFQLVNNPSAYNGPQFAAQMKKVNSTLR
jgi:hypothetical protein